MVLIAQINDASDVRIMARGNFSLDAGGLIAVLLALTLVTLGLAGLLAWQGFWPVLAIAVIQVVLVAWTLIRAWERTWVSEQIDIGPERINVMQQRHRRKRHFELDGAWAVVELERPEIAWYGPRVILRSRGRAVELGKFLTLDEKMQLAEYVRKTIQKHSVLEGAFNA